MEQMMFEMLDKVERITRRENEETRSMVSENLEINAENFELLNEIYEIQMMNDEKNENERVNEEIKVLTKITEELVLDEKEKLMYDDRILELKCWKMKQVIGSKSTNDEFVNTLYGFIEEEIECMLRDRSILLKTLLEKSDEDMEEVVKKRLKKVVSEYEQ